MSGGSSDSDANELTVAPYGLPASMVLTTVTGAHTPAIRSRKRCGLIPVSDM